WGTYVFTGTEWQNDRYLEADHAWGGGIDFKYFFHRYFGVGIEGFGLDVRQARENLIDTDVIEGVSTSTFDNHREAIGAVLGTFTLRYPIHCSRFSPYIWGGVGGIFGGGQRPINTFVREGGTIAQGGEGFDDTKVTVGHTDSESRVMGQVGGGM